MAVFTFFCKCRLKINTHAETANPQRSLSNGCSIYFNIPNQLLQSFVLTGQMEMSFTKICPRNDIILWKKCSKCDVLIMHQAYELWGRRCKFKWNQYTRKLVQKGITSSDKVQLHWSNIQDKDLTSSTGCLLLKTRKCSDSVLAFREKSKPMQ